MIDQKRVLTYRELDGAANQVANHLLSQGIGRGWRVGLYMDKSLEAVVALYGILKVGAAYVPLDPRAPVARLAYIAANCGLSWLISDTKHQGHWLQLVAAGAPVTNVIVLDGETAVPNLKTWGRTAIGSQSAASPDRKVIDEDLAYILYTSGSTGEPKGVMLSHRNAMAFVEWTICELSLDSEDRLSSHAPFHFDLSIFDLFAAAGAGASVALVPSATSVFPVEVARFIKANEITVWYSVPSILSLLSQHANLTEGSLSSLRLVIFAGEVFPSKYLARLMGQLPAVAFHNWYGPTETNVCTAYRVETTPDPAGLDIPIGRSIANVETVVVTAEGLRAQPEEVGELFVRGATVMRGYWADEERTSARLVPSPFESSGERYYRTGDLVMEDTSGNLRFLGRRDHQIKSRGYRIELGEIETALNAHPEVTECVVVAIPDEVISNRIVAHVVARGDIKSGDLAEWCARRIPRYMIPESFQFADELPKTSTGKIDRQALQQRV